MKFTIIIPTRERADTLYWTIKTCIMQDYDNLTILVCDNLSQDNTEEVVKSFDDPRIQYIQTDKRLSMSGNWDFAIAHVREGFVTILGDDDGFLVNGIADAASLIETHNLLALNQKSDTYCWPNHLNERQRGILSISLINDFEKVESKQMLKNTLSVPTAYEKLPWLYRGFVHIDVINKIKKLTGSQNFFKSMIPDVYSGVAMTNLIKEYGYSNKALALNGASGHSGGTSLFNPSKSKKSFDKFMSEDNIAFHTKLSNCPSIAILLAESFYQVMDAGLELDVNINLKDILEIAIQDYKKSDPIIKDKIRVALDEIGTKNGLSDFINQKLGEEGNSIIQKKNQSIVKGYNFLTKTVVLNASNYEASNVYEAVLLHNKILTERPSEIFSTFSTVKMMMDVVSKKGIIGTAGGMVRQIKSRLETTK